MLQSQSLTNSESDAEAGASNAAATNVAATTGASPDSSSPASGAHTGLPRHRLLGFNVNPGSISEYLQLIQSSIRQNHKETVFYHNLHSLYTYFTLEPLRRAYRGTTVLVDGMPVIWLLQLFRRPATREQRVTYVDFIWPMMEQARDNGWKVFHLGQSAEVQQQALEIIRERVPGIEISGHDGYFDLSDESPDSARVISEVNAFGTQLLLVGFGAPKQEYWVATHRESIDAPALFTCGACMEYLAGAVNTPPRWMGKLGLEWSYRLFENPRRFAFRYLVEPILLGLMLARNAITGGPKDPDDVSGRSASTTSPGAGNSDQ